MVQVLEIQKSLYADNDRQAEQVRTELREKGVLLLNLMASPGAGKTTMLTRTLPLLRDRLNVGVIEADIDSDVDARALEAVGVRTVQLHTGGMCHLDANMTRQGLAALGTDGMDLIILENIGNLVCPAGFDTGADLNVMILSVPEGDDKPLKYPLMFTVCDVLLISKIDVADRFDFDLTAVEARARKLNPEIRIFPISARTGEGVGAWADWLYQETRTRAGK